MDGLNIARQRIAQEAKRRTGFLDIGCLSLTKLPDELLELKHLRRLNLGWYFHDEAGQLDYSASWIGNNHFEGQLDGLVGLTELQYLSVTGRRFDDLAPLQGLAQLQVPSSLRSLDCGGTEVSDLAPLESFAKLQSLNCRFTKVSNLAALRGLASLQSLDCAGTKVSDLAPLQSLDGLRSFNCAVTKVSDLSPLQGLASLQSLYCGGTEVSDLAPLQGLALLSLDCAGTKVSDLSPLRRLISLQSLDCAGTKVSDLSPLRRLTGLQSLDCGGTEVSDLAPLRRLTSLQSLNCERTDVSDLAPLRSLASLRSLNCEWTDVSDFSPLQCLVSLQNLYCSGTQLSDLALLRGLVSLQSLGCSETQVGDLAPLQGLCTLGSLDCSETQVGDLAPLEGLATLRWLDCSYTKVENLAPLRAIAGLRSLDCSYTRVADLAPLEGLAGLQSLHCSGCRLTAASESLWFKSSLEKLELHKTQISNVPAEVLSQSPNENCLESLRAHLRDLAAGRDMMSDVKLMVLGNGRSGKTQLSRRLCGQPFQPEWDSTHGVRMASSNLPTADGDQGVPLHLWDFGGQDIYHGTHALFVRTRAVFLLVWAKDTEPPSAPYEYEHQGISCRNHPLAYWVDYVRHLAQAESPVIIVQTKCDSAVDEEPRAPVQDEALRALGFRREIHFSSGNDRGLDELEAALRGAVAWLREREGIAEIGVGRLRVQRRIEGLRDAAGGLPPDYRLINQDTFRAWCRETGGVSSPEHLLAYLHNGGILFYRAGLFRNQIVLDHAWALNAIYAVFDRTRCYKRLQKEGGRFDRLRLDELIWREQGYSADEQRLFLDMMQSCGICFVYRKARRGYEDETIYVAPDLLPGRGTVQTELDDRWGPDPEDWTIIFDYALLHPGVMRSVIARIGNQAGLDAIYWRGGVYVYETTTRSRALIEQDNEGWRGAVRLQTKGGQSRELSQRLAGWISEENEQLGLRPEVKGGTPMPARSIEPRVSASRMEFGQEPATRPEYWVSYARNDETPEGSKREAVVDRLCAEAEKRGIRMLRDKADMQLGDRISAFMRRLARGERIFVILSEKYLRSIYCMTELYQIWQNCRSDDQEFMARLRVFTLPDARIADLHERTAHAVWWKQEHARVKGVVDEHGADILSPDDYVQFRDMGHFVRHVPDILSLVQDTLRPRSFDELIRDGFRCDERPELGIT